MSVSRPVTGATRLAAVIGKPVRHSLSPVIHNAAFGACGIDGVYVALPVEPGQSLLAIQAMRAFDWFGMSVTMPHKHEVLEHCDIVTPIADRLGSVNCVFRDADGAIVGDNTDGEGFVAGLQSDLDVDPRGLCCAVVGAGGAAKAVVSALAEAGAAQVLIINRNPDRAAAAASLGGGRGVVAVPEQLVEADVVVNATPLGMASTDHASAVPFDVAALRPDAVVSDLIYHPAETPLLALVRSRGLRAQNGLPMLVHQAVGQFERWTATTPPVEVLHAAVTDALDARGPT